MTPLDSDAREVRCLHGMTWPCSTHGPVVYLPPSLAQRILAALEAEQFAYDQDDPRADALEALAAELRALVTR